MPVKPRDPALTRSYSALVDAIGPSDINVVFQPIVDLKTRRLFALEALVRCSALGLQSPPTLFEHAVKHSYTGRLGRMIREITVARCPGIPIFPNVHPSELAQRWPELAAEYRSALANVTSPEAWEETFRPWLENTGSSEAQA